MAYNYEFKIDLNETTLLELEKELLRLQHIHEIEECFFLTRLKGDTSVYFHTDIEVMEDQFRDLMHRLGYDAKPIDEKTVVDRLNIKIPKRAETYGCREMAIYLRRGMPFKP